MFLVAGLIFSFRCLRGASLMLVTTSAPQLASLRWKHSRFVQSGYWISDRTIPAVLYSTEDDSACLQMTAALHPDTEWYCWKMWGVTNPSCKTGANMWKPNNGSPKAPKTPSPNHTARGGRKPRRPQAPKAPLQVVIPDKLSRDCVGVPSPQEAARIGIHKYARDRQVCSLDPSSSASP